MRLVKANPPCSLHTEFTDTTENTMETEEPKKAKRVRVRREKVSSVLQGNTA